MLHRFLANSRYIIIVAVVSSLLATVTLLLYGAVRMVNTIGALLIGGKVSSEVGKTLVVDFIEIIDLFLLATVFYIISLGLYELFVDDRIKVPEWLEIHDLDDLKNKLTSVTVVLLGVLYLGQVVGWRGGTDILPYGLSIALVIAALTYFLRGKTKKP